MSHRILTNIWIYPIKSLGGIPLKTAKVLKKGLEHDRRWMLIDRNNIAITQRDVPGMALLRPYISGDSIIVNHVKSGRIVSSADFGILEPPRSASFTAEVWGDPVLVQEVDEALSTWFSKELEITCRLVVFPENNSRPVDPDYSVNNEHVSLADAFPFLIIGQSSLDDLNARMGEPVPMNRFRPNFVFDGGSPYEEDNWKEISIGQIPFRGVKKSARCVLTTVDQETAHKGVEPLKTLTTYRRTNNKIYFGQNLVSLATGNVNVGDKIIPA